jgi:hypothetical protein
MNKKNIKRFIVSFIIIAIFLISVANRANAATLYISPSSSSIELGSTFTIAVKTDTKGAKVNVAEATISFNSEKLEAVKVTPGSTFTLETPGSPYKTEAKVFFSAGLPSPGYKGSSGSLGSITFRAIGTGKTNINIASGKILLNDGNATDALNGTSGSTISISKPVEKIIENAPSPLPEEEQQNQIITNVTEEQAETQPVSSILRPSDNVYTATITITVEDLIHVLYVLVILIILLLIAVIYLLVVNSRLKNHGKRQ